MKKEVKIPKIEDYLFFRYNLYMIEYMYEYIVERLKNQFPIENNSLMQEAFGTEKKEFLYKIFKTNRTDFSKYKHSDIEKKPVTKNVRSVFMEYPELAQFITGEKLIIDNMDEEEYPNEHELQISEKTKKRLKRSVDNAWVVLSDRMSMDALRDKGIILELAGWMIIKIGEEYNKLRNKEDTIDNIVLREFEHLDKISFEMLDMCEFETIEVLANKAKKINLMLTTVYQYKRYKKNKK